MSKSVHCQQPFGSDKCCLTGFAPTTPTELLGHALRLTKTGPCIRCLVSARARGILTRRSQTSHLHGKTPGTSWSYSYRGLDSSAQNFLSPGLRDVRTSWLLVGETDPGGEVGRAGQRNWGYLSWLLRLLTRVLCEVWQHIPHPGALLTILLLLQFWPVLMQYICVAGLFYANWVKKSLLLMVLSHWYLAPQIHDIRSFSM